MSVPKIIAIIVVSVVVILGVRNLMPSNSNWQHYESQKYGLAFDYPANFKVLEDDGGAAINLSPQVKGLLPIKFYLRDYAVESPDFVTTMADTQGYLEAKIARIEGGQYSFDQEEINGLPVVLHKRNVLGLIGNVYELYADWDGQFLTISSEAPIEITDRVYRSLKKI